MSTALAVLPPPPPRTRGECLRGPRPCPHVGCRHHLAVEIRAWRRGELEVCATDSCSLDVADRGEQTLEAVGALLGVTRERVRQIELVARRRLRSQLAEWGAVPRRHVGAQNE